MLIQSYKKKLLIAFLVAFGVAGYSFISANNARAQENPTNNLTEDITDQLLADGNEEGEEVYDPANYQQWKDNFKPTPVGDMAFRKNKKGCAQKMAFSSILIKRYKSGEGIDDLTESPILGPYMKEQYNKIRENGLAQTQKSMLKDYQDCMENAKAEEDPGDEYDLDMRYGACNSLNAILLDTVQSIQKRQNIETVLRRHSSRAPDLSETAYGRLEDPVSMLISKLYKEAQDSEGKSQKEISDSLHEQASQMILACTM